MRIISNFVDYYDCCQKNGINRELVMKIEFEVLINSNFGGFSIPNEIVLWLHKNKGWELPAKNGKDNSKFSSMYNNESYLKDKSIKSRSDPELIEAYKVCKTEWNKREKSHKDKYYSQMSSLKLVKVIANFDVEDYYDGKEKIISWVSEENSDFEENL
jgi:hypothetical protein